MKKYRLTHGNILGTKLAIAITNTLKLIGVPKKRDDRTNQSTLTGDVKSPRALSEFPWVSNVSTHLSQLNAFSRITQVGFFLEEIVSIEASLKLFFCFRKKIFI